jgi:AcrR family transcriptional regulator
MTSDVNIVNTDPGDTGRGYHHGNLRSALLEAGLELLEAGDGSPPALREVARRAGVSAAAVYRHFPDKAALLAAMAGEGMRRLAAEQEGARAASGAGMAGFNATGRAYVRFALANPALYRLMFSSAPSRDLLGGPIAAAPRPMRRLREDVAEVFGRAQDPAAPRVFALRAWAMVHGLAMLALDRQVDTATVETLLDRIIDADCFGVGLAA